MQYRYHVQDVFYTDILKQNGVEIKYFIFLAIEKKPPYAWGLYVVNSNDKLDAMAMIETDIRTYAECMRTNIWNSYTSKITEL